MAVGTKELAPAQLRGFDDERLADELGKAKEELFNLRFQSATGQLANHARLRAVRKDIARIYTEMRERELGITTPVTTTADASGTAPARADRKAARAARRGAKGKEKTT